MATQLGVLGALTRLEDALLNALAPRACVVCARQGGWLCPAHQTELFRVADWATQQVAGVPVLSLGSYAEPTLAAIVQAAKYGGMWEAYSVSLGMWPEYLWSVGIAALVPVPIHPTRLFVRAYNQAEELAQVIGRQYGLPVANCLRRLDRSPSRVGLGKQERLEVTPRIVARRRGTGRILLVDDVITTGSTLVAAIEAAITAGYQVVGALTLAATPPKNLP